MSARTNLRAYSDRLTAEVNRKGVLDVDTVKGCPAVTTAHPHGCYDACYAVRTAQFRGLDFSPVSRRVFSAAHARAIEKTVKQAPHGFFRVGVMGDPSCDWPHTVRIVKWLTVFAVPVIVTKHWRPLPDGELVQLVESGAILNTSISALDSPAQLAHRRKEIRRYAALGGVSVARIVSCDFNLESHDGARLARIQTELFSDFTEVIDNPLRLRKSHPLVENGTVRVVSMPDLSSKPISISLHRKDTYIGHCAGCVDVCGLRFVRDDHPRPKHPQFDCFGGEQ